MDARNLIPTAERLGAESTRRAAVKRLGALALGAVAVAGIGRSASARNDPNNDNVDKECLNRCRDHKQNRCHQRCRRNR
jgi:hypothetical protein